MQDLSNTSKNFYYGIVRRSDKIWNSEMYLYERAAQKDGKNLNVY